MPGFYHKPCRAAPSFLQAINPVWWLSDATKSENGPSWSWARWARRNFASNFLSTIVGVGHLPHTFWAEADTIWRADGRLRLAWTTCRSRPPLPLLSWKTATREKCVGWKTDGSLSITWRVRCAHEAKP